ncbi:hypothetical protein B0A55_00219 [Friedmanniomyces simplex]|uniref:Uncharacterized protein n=1 Tax=Friedmanniomyces simplex TaxID=329884 RepID=A0A4U0Y577_9PEZI|nr:hypothetical protein B0A55_00219 [Friedmanniomyces simplex]
MDYAAINTQQANSGGRRWQSGFFRRFPWAGFLCIVGALLGVVASIAILKASDGVPISDWKYSPTVYLSISYTITNILLAVALSHGVTISWWRKALGAKTELGDLHRYWNFGTSPAAAFTSGKKFNFIAFACLLVAVTPANGPLLQRSSSVAVQVASTPVTMQIKAAPFIQSPTGYLSGRGLAVSLISTEFAPTVQSFYDGHSVSANYSGCPRDGICTGWLQGAGLAVNCSSYSAPYNITPAIPFNASTDPAVEGSDIFTTGFTWSAQGPGNFTLNTQYKDTSSLAPFPECSGMLTVQNCTLKAATVQYPVIVNGNQSIITLDPSSSIVDDIVNDIADYPIVDMPGPTFLGGYAFALNNRFEGVSHMRFVGAVGFELLSTGATGPQFANMDDVHDYEDGMCNIKFSDPVQNLLAQARELMFRTSLAFGNSSNVQTVFGTAARTTNVYRSHYDFLAAAVALTLVSILVVLATFAGFWSLGRSVSMSPIEIVKAFNAPLLAAEDSNAEAKELVKCAGGRPVRYRLVPNAVGMDEDKAGSYVGVAEVERTEMHLEILDARASY